MNRKFEGFTPSTVDGRNFTSRKIETMWHLSLDFDIFLYIFIYVHILLYIFVLFHVFDVKLIANKQGAPEAPLIHYPINVTFKQNPKKYKKASKNI